MKLDDLRKKNIYKVPDGYFDELPGRIQKRIQEEKAIKSRFSLSWSLSYKVLAPVAVAVLLLFFFVFKTDTTDPSALSYDQMLSEVSTEGMVSYLEMEGISSFEILENVDLEGLEENFEDDAGYIELEEEVNDELLDAIIDEYDFDIENI